MERLVALPGSVLVAPGDLDRTNEGQQLVPGTKLLYGREVWPPWGIVVASGEPALAVGSKVIVPNDEGAPTWRGMRLILLHTTRRRAAVEDARLARARRLSGLQARDPEEVPAVVEADGSYRALGSRVIVRMHAPENESEVLDVVGGFKPPLDWGEVVSVGELVRTVAVGDVVAWRHDAGVRWSERDERWCSVRETELDLVEVV